MSDIVSELNTALFNLGNDTLRTVVGGALWRGLDEAMEGGVVNEEVEWWKYTSTKSEGSPEITDDPLTEAGSLWSTIFFLHHKKLKRMAIVTFRTTSIYSSTPGEDELENGTDFDISPNPEEEKDDKYDVELDMGFDMDLEKDIQGVDEQGRSECEVGNLECGLVGVH